jgi:hypothetical protein
MKRTSLFVAFAALVLSFGLAYGQGMMSLDHVVGNFTYGAPVAIGDTVQTGVPIEFYIRWNNTTGANIIGATTGFRVYSEAAEGNAVFGAITWLPKLVGTTIIDLFPGWHTTYFDYSCDMNPYGVGGAGADTIGFAGTKKYGGIPIGFSEVVYMVAVPAIAETEVGKHICIDSSFYPPTNEWLWSSDTGDPGDVLPAWSGPHCFYIFKVPNQRPHMVDCGPFPSFDHCALATYPFTADDPEDDPFTFTQDSGPGTTNANSGVWTYQPTIADVGAALTVVVHASDAGGPGLPCDPPPAVNVTNNAPTFVTGCGAIVIKSGGDVAVQQMTAKSNEITLCTDPMNFSIVSVNPVPAGGLGAVTVSGTGLISFATQMADGGVYFTVVVRVSDTKAGSECPVYFDIKQGAPVKIAIDYCTKDLQKVAYQGGHYNVDVNLVSNPYQLGGFNILIAYDASALSFQKAKEGERFYVDPVGTGECKWEYFTYRFGAEGNCGNACPSGLLRVIGIAETNNGDNHPFCFAPTPLPTPMFHLDFLVSNDRTLECQCIPIRFFWTKCDDNSLSDKTGDRLLISMGVFEGLFPDIDVHNVAVGYPTYLGAQNEDCFIGSQTKEPYREIDFVNGGIQVACADSIDARGDINLNDVAYEIADAVLFSNYFVHGSSVFVKNPQGQIAATDVNADGIALSVADLVYLIRVVVGDAVPYDKLVPVEAAYTVSLNGTISVDHQMGAAYIVASGDVTPILHANNMQMLFEYDGAITRILVWSEIGNSFTGDFVTVNGNVTSVEMATPEGAPVVAKESLPTDYSLNQNYPNPFNPTTNITFSLPSASDYSVTIYNVTGQRVATMSGHGEAGQHVVEWNAANQASGIYFYKLDAGTFSATKKMVLLK